MSAQSYEFVQLFARQTQLGGEGRSVTAYGPDMRNWPSKVVDAFVLLEAERVKVDSLKLNIDEEAPDAAQ